MTAAVLDACVAINLAATGRMEAIVRGLDLALVESPQVHGETPAAIEPLRAARLLTVRALDTDLLRAAFVRAAPHVGDGDASCIALAGELAIPLLTDDRKARRIARELYPSIRLISTLDLVADAARALDWSDAMLRRVAQDLCVDGRFEPPRSDPRRAWYAALLGR